MRDFLTRLGKVLLVGAFGVTSNDNGYYEAGLWLFVIGCIATAALIALIAFYAILCGTRKEQQ